MPEWLSQLSVQLLILVQVVCDLTIRGFEPQVRLCADSMEPAFDSVSPISLFFLQSQMHVLVLSIYISQNNEINFFEKEKET